MQQIHRHEIINSSTGWKDNIFIGNNRNGKRKIVGDPRAGEIRGAK